MGGKEPVCVGRALRVQGLNQADLRFPFCDFWSSDAPFIVWAQVAASHVTAAHTHAHSLCTWDGAQQECRLPFTYVICKAECRAPPWGAPTSPCSSTRSQCMRASPGTLLLLLLLLLLVLVLLLLLLLVLVLLVLQMLLVLVLLVLVLLPLLQRLG